MHRFGRGTGKQFAVAVKKTDGDVVATDTPGSARIIPIGYFKGFPQEEVPSLFGNTLRLFHEVYQFRSTSVIGDQKKDLPLIAV